ncbi:hypothetical protein THRCLA_08137 [Thraustotheca clavata]|uniref:26S proteasome non-ATPase regulatory subunit 5 n=1 Tax=Thraustotheca clavata TaxID=74557 RepID=A0A1V9Z9G8_9STRA|nr:hypothetical protein THRCLA_08137 [Thraustotheca clavata]
MSEQAWSTLSTFHAHSVATVGNRESPIERELVHDLMQKMPMQMIFLCLQQASDANDTKHVKLVCQCLERIFRSPIGSEILFQDEMLPFLIAGVLHNEQIARKLTLDMIDLQLQQKYHEKMNNEELLDAICNDILDEDAGVARKASDILFKVFYQSQQNNIFAELVSSPESGIYHSILRLLSQVLSAHFPRLSKDNSVEYVRLLETIAKISTISDDVMKESAARGLLRPIFDGIKSSDSLFQLNILDIIPVICNCKAGLSLVFESDPLIGGAALRLVGQFSTKAASLGISSWNWSDAALSKAFLDAIESSFQAGDNLQKIAAMDAIAAFASASLNELELFLQHKTLITLFFLNAQSTVMEVKSNCIVALATIMARPTRLVVSVNAIPDESHGIWLLNQKLFASLGGRLSPMDYLMECLRQPFDTIRVAVYTLLQAVAAQGHPWGLQVLLAYGGFIEFVVDRRTEPSKSTREWKFALADAICASSYCGLLGQQQLQSIKDYVSQGPYAGAMARPELLLDSA